MSGVLCQLRIILCNSGPGELKMVVPDAKQNPTIKLVIEM